MLKAYRGSPPHARGKDHLVAHQLVHAGITPAYAGKRLRRTRCTAFRKDHPRIRWEKRKNAARKHGLQGSPPHARGKATEPAGMQEKTGITPACAGKRKSRSTRDKYTRDHPRMRGEKQFKAGTPMELRGSPPHARGKGDARQHAGGNVRITPACAGKRTSRNTRILQSPDHPRMRGEKCAGKKINLVHLGSPPHTRGKGGRGQQFGVRPRITPRIRGEKLSLIVMLKSALGSPPHTRGKDLESPEKSTFLLCRTSDFI